MNKARELISAVTGIGLGISSMLGGGGPARVGGAEAAANEPQKQERVLQQDEITALLGEACLPTQGFDMRGAVKTGSDGKTYQCDGQTWQEVTRGLGVGEFDPAVGGVRLDEWPDSKDPTFRFSHWASPATYDATMKKWIQVACYGGAGGLGCDIRYEVPAPTSTGKPRPKK